MSARVRYGGAGKWTNNSRVADEGDVIEIRQIFDEADFASK
jgi:hypothetical protein